MPGDLPMVIRVPMRPRAQPRPRGKPGQKAYYPKDYADWRVEAGWRIREIITEIGRKHIPQGPVSVSIALGPASFTIHITPLTDMRSETRLRGDVDNYAKAVLDLLMDTEVLADDREVHLLSVGFYGED